MKATLLFRIVMALPALLASIIGVVVLAVFGVMILAGAALNKPSEDASVSASISSVGADGWIHPAGGAFIWSTYSGVTHSHDHGAVDLPLGFGTPVYAANDGVIHHAGWLGSYGNAVVIHHDTTTATLYAHFSDVLVKNGQKVKAGQPVGLVGSTGMSSGPHLHFEIRLGGVTSANIVPAYTFFKSVGIELGECYSGPCSLAGG